MPDLQLAHVLGVDASTDPPQVLYISQELDFFLVADPRFWAEKLTFRGKPFKRLSLSMWCALQEAEDQHKTMELKAIIDAHPHLLQ